VNLPLAELYDYDSVRNEREATMYVVHAPLATLVLGSAQSTEILDQRRVKGTALRRRRGGGGLVLVQPGDLWIDWWIPSDDQRWRSDVHASSRMVGEWWAKALQEVVPGVVTVHDGPLEGDQAYRLVCFAGRGPGEVFVDGRKAVGVTQWRVREGVFVSTIMHSRSSADVLRYLKEVPEGLASALDHHVLPSTEVVRETLTESLRHSDGPWQLREQPLHD